MTVTFIDENGSERSEVFKLPKLPAWSMAAEIGYKPKTTFWEGFSIADLFGIDAVKDTFNRAFAAWRDDVEYIAELALVLNHKGCFYYNASEQHDNDKGLYAFSQTYFAMYQTVHDYAHEHFTGDDADYYFKVTD